MCDATCFSWQEGDQEPVPVSFRYNLAPTKSMRTNVFRPNNMQGEPRLATMGALFIGKWDKLPQSEFVDVLYEACSFV